MLIRDAELDGTRVDVRCAAGHIVELGRFLAASPGEDVLPAAGGALLPGLHDHHLHLLALAAASRSVACGPPAVGDREALRAALADAPGSGWIRGVGYHESVAGSLDRATIDTLCGHRPVRIQHDSGRVWFLNSLAMQWLGLPAAGDGELFRGDDWLRARLADPLDLDAELLATSERLARCGVTGVTDASPANDDDTAARFARLGLRQRVHLLGNERLAGGALKIMLDDYALPDIDALRARIVAAHEHNRPVAIHCVTRTELVFAAAVLVEAGSLAGDRIEHASVTDAASLALLQRAGLTVITQPNLVAERGDRYLAEVDPAEHALLYRCAGLLAAGVRVAGGTDAPYGQPDPWAAMRAAVLRRTPTGRPLGVREAVSPEQALALFTTPPADPGGAPRRVAVGEPADLCLLRCAWSRARQRLLAEDVAATIAGGRLTYLAGTGG